MRGDRKTKVWEQFGSPLHLHFCESRLPGTTTDAMERDLRWSSTRAADERLRIELVRTRLCMRGEAAHARSVDMRLINHS